MNFRNRTPDSDLERVVAQRKATQLLYQLLDEQVFGEGSPQLYPLNNRLTSLVGPTGSGWVWSNVLSDGLRFFKVMPSHPKGGPKGGIHERVCVHVDGNSDPLPEQPDCETAG